MDSFTFRTRKNLIVVAKISIHHHKENVVNTIMRYLKIVFSLLQEHWIVLSRKCYTSCSFLFEIVPRKKYRPVARIDNYALVLMTQSKESLWGR